MKKEVIDALKSRYSVNVFDTGKKVNIDDLETILESGRLAPSSFGFEPWKFIVVENPETRMKLQEVGYGQSKISQASHLIVLARRTDARESLVNERIDRTAKIYSVAPETLDTFRGMMEGSIAGKSNESLDANVTAQVYIALGVMMTTAALLGIDSAPMEGFDPIAVNEILELNEKHLSSTVLLAIGYRGEDPSASHPKVRRIFEDVVEFVK